MKDAPAHPREAERLEVLRACGVMDTAPEPEFDALVSLASTLTGCPIALVSLVDASRQWFKARVGLEASSTARRVSFCGHAIVEGDLIVEDARIDPRFADNPLVLGEPNVVSYIGLVLTVAGEAVGTLCVIDHAPRRLDARTLGMLRQLARQVEVLLESRRRAHQLEQTVLELRRAEEKLRAVERAMHDGLVMQEQSGAIIWHNEAACRILGLTAGQLTGRTSMDPRWGSVHEDGSPFPGDQHPAMVALGGTRVRDVVMGVGVEGSRRWIRINAEPVWQPGETKPWAVVTSFHDVSDELQRERDLRAAREKAEASTRAKAQFLATMSHELRTPMNGIIGLSDLLLTEALPVEHRQTVHTIRESGTALLRIIDDVLDFSKIEAGGRALVSEPLHPRAIAGSVIELLRSQAAAKGLELRLEAHGEPGALGDGDALRQVLLNLVGNALKFTPVGRVDVTVRAADDGCLIEVKDTGIGLTAEQQGRLFERFSQAESSIARRFGGTGLGLAICKRLVEGMGGAIGVQSQAGVGSSFWVRLPPAPLPVAPASPPVPTLGGGRRTLSVLVAEDNPINQRVILGMLERLQHRAVLAANGEEAVAAASRQAFDLVLMDVQMPEVDGLEATRRLRARGFTAPILALTASVLGDEREACLEAGMLGVLAKPLTLAALRSRLEALGVERAA